VLVAGIAGGTTSGVTNLGICDDGNMLCRLPAAADSTPLREPR
jgi:hypothetical protein